MTYSLLLVCRDGGDCADGEFNLGVKPARAEAWALSLDELRMKLGEEG